MGLKKTDAWFLDDKKKGKHKVGSDGLVLWVKSATSKSWLLRLYVNGVRKEIGLGSVKKMTMDEAFEEVQKRHALNDAGKDPTNGGIKAREQEPETVKLLTFEEAARCCYADKMPGWKNEKHAQQWINSLTNYAFPLIGETLVADLTALEIRAVVNAIWLSKPETARRVLQRIGTVLDWAITYEHREKACPTTSIKKNMAKQPEKGHFPAMPFAELPEYMPELRGRESVGRLALEFLVLTATRSGEVRLAPWSEIDIDGALWTIPKDRMKMNKAHAIPLSEAALAVLARMKELFGDAPSAYIFPGSKHDSALSDMTLSKILRDAEKTVLVDGETKNVVPHGFRSSFKTWASEETDYKNKVSEAALAHGNPDKVEAAYLRSDFFQHRVGLMNDWADYLAA